MEILTNKFAKNQVNPGRVMLQILPYAIAVLLTFLVTLSAFPAVSAQVLHHLLFFAIFTSLCRLCPPQMPTRCGRASSMFQLPASYSSTSGTMLAGALHTLQIEESDHFDKLVDDVDDL